MKYIVTALVVFLTFAFGACEYEDNNNSSNEKGSKVESKWWWNSGSSSSSSSSSSLVDANCNSTEGSSIRYGLTNDFRNWLEANNYEPAYNLARDDLSGGSFGGKASSSDCVKNQPVIFIHGNSDRALGGTYGGWTDSVEYFLSRGYRMSELYGTTWGPASTAMVSFQYHSKTYVSKIRAFIKAVKEYTGADKVDVITHSMGVTLTRKAIKGGSSHDSLEGGYYNLGSSLTSSIDTFVGISGSNLGLVACYMTGPTTPTCGSTNGFYPGYLWWGWVMGRSDILDDLRSSSGYEGSKVYTIWSKIDEIIGYGCVVYGSYTTRIPGQDGEKVYSRVPYGHFGTKNLTGSIQYNMVKNHSY